MARVRARAGSLGGEMCAFKLACASNYVICSAKDMLVNENKKLLGFLEHNFSFRISRAMNVLSILLAETLTFVLCRLSILFQTFKLRGLDAYSTLTCNA